MSKEVLCFVKCLTRPDSDGEYVYEFYFTSNPDDFYGEDFGESPCSCCVDLKPCDDAFDFTRRVRVPFALTTIGECTQFSVQDAIDGCVCLCYEDLFDKEYPEHRLVFLFGDTYEKVEEKLGLRNLKLE